MGDLESLRLDIYRQQLRVEGLRREVFMLPALERMDEQLDALAAAEQELAESEARLADLQTKDPGSGRLVAISPSISAPAISGTMRYESGPGGAQRGEITGLEANIYLRMSQVPTAFYHLLDKDKTPLLSCTIKNHTSGKKIRRVRVITQIEGYSAPAITTLELKGQEERSFNHLPTLFPERIQQVTELTRATLSVLVEDLEAAPPRVEEHSTHPLWLLARTTAPLAVRDPQSGLWQDLSQYIGAYVTPNASDLMAFLRHAAELHPQHKLAGYQGSKADVEPQVKALYEALKAKGEITYVNSVVEFSPDQGSANQRVRLPRESLAHKLANCIDGVVLFASLLEGISLSPAIAFIPGHALVAWETWSDAPGEWRFLETTLIRDGSFEEACAKGQAAAVRYRRIQEVTRNPMAFRLWPLRTLRTEFGITPME